MPVSQIIYIQIHIYCKFSFIRNIVVKPPPIPGGSKKGQERGTHTEKNAASEFTILEALLSTNYKTF